MEFNKATDIERDMYFNDSRGVCRVMTVAEGYVMLTYIEKPRPYVLLWTNFLLIFKKIPQSKYPKKLCKCGCGWNISHFSSRKRKFKNNAHKCRHYSKLRMRKLREEVTV